MSSSSVLALLGLGVRKIVLRVASGDGFSVYCVGVGSGSVGVSCTCCVCCWCVMAGGAVSCTIIGVSGSCNVLSACWCEALAVGCGIWDRGVKDRTSSSSLSEKGSIRSRDTCHFFFVLLLSKVAVLFVSFISTMVKGPVKGGVNFGPRGVRLPGT